MKKAGKLLIVFIAVVAVGIFARNRLLQGGDESYEYFTSAVSRGTIQNTIAATGNVEAMVTVEVGSQVTGQVQKLYADFNSVVTEGQRLALLDPRNVEAQLRNAKANLRSAESRILTAEADRKNADISLESAQANMESARLDLNQAQLNFDRSKTLFEADLVAETELENATIQLQSAQARMIQQQASVQQSEAQIISRDASVDQAYASLEQAQADVQEAELNVEYTDIRSPVSGVVISREVDVGQTVSASTSAPTLFIIANDLSRMRVQASIDEADIGLLGQNNEVTFRVDAYPDDEFTGRIEEIRLNPSTDQNVVTYSVIVTFENPDLKLKPGMTANITILVARKEDVVSVPNTALRYTPPDVDVNAVLESRSQGTGIVAEASAEVLTGSEGQAFEPVADASIPGLSASPPQARQGGTSVMAGQEWDDSVKIQFAAAPPEPPRPGRVWVMPESQIPEPRDLMLGLTDGSRTEVISGNIEIGELVLIGDTANLADGEESGSSSSGDPRSMMRMLGGYR